MLIAGPNLTIDRTGTLDDLRPGAVLRFRSMEVTPGGKGLNVARASRALGAPAVLVGFVPGRIGAAAAEMIAAEEVELRGVPARGELRSTTIVMEPTGRTTVINEPGPELEPGEWDAYEAEIAAALEGQRVLVCSGSIPPGAPKGAYGRLVELARARGAAAVVDGSGAALSEALGSAGRHPAEPRRGRADPGRWYGRGRRRGGRRPPARPGGRRGAGAARGRGRGGHGCGGRRGARGR